MIVGGKCALLPYGHRNLATRVDIRSRQGGWGGSGLDRTAVSVLACPRAELLMRPDDGSITGDRVVSGAFGPELVPEVVGN